MTESDILDVVEEYYSFTPSSVQSIVSNERKGVWKVKDGRNQYAVKHFRGDSIYSILVADFLGQKRISPKLVKTKANEPFVSQKGANFFITRWMDGQMAVSPQHYIDAVALFHKNAQGPKLAENARHGPLTLERWLRMYEKRHEKLEKWSMQTETGQLQSACTRMLKLMEQVIHKLNTMETSGYIEYTASRGTLVHWDLHRGNILFDRNNHPYILDLDSVENSFQVCDLHQVLSDAMEKMGESPDQVPLLLNRYFYIYRDVECFRPVYDVVCCFPHYFWNAAERSMVYDGGLNANAERLCHISGLEWEKKDAIELFNKRKVGETCH